MRVSTRDFRVLIRGRGPWPVHGDRNVRFRRAILDHADDVGPRLIASHSTFGRASSDAATLVRLTAVESLPRPPFTPEIPMGVRPPARPVRLRPRPAPPEIVARTPPGQFITQRLPVLHYGDIPVISLDDWRLTVDGLVEQSLSLSWHDLEAFPRVGLTADMHCVTRWSRLDVRWQGIPAGAVLAASRPTPTARFVLISCAGGYDTNLPVADFAAGDVLLATDLDGEPLTPEHGFPLRLVVPKRYAWKSAKWVTGLRFLAGDEPGFWERYGYHNDADPWREQRFSE